MGEERHSEHFFTDARDFWWNEDFLRLMARRWRLESVRSVLDVGCGVGHWSAALLKVLPAEARITAVDREPAWVETSRRRFPERIQVAQATAEKLPFPDASFDMVTCQTVLIHLADPSRALAEMLRVLKPGGLLAAAEPSNIAQTGESVAPSHEDAVTLFRLNLLCERGKAALGEGNNSVGDLLPGLFAARGLTNIQVYLSDKAFALYPPYAAPGQKEMTADRLRDAETGYQMMGREQTRRYYLAAGGTVDDFERAWVVGLAHMQECVRATSDGSLHGGGGHVMYLVSGRK